MAREMKKTKGASAPSSSNVSQPVQRTAAEVKQYYEANKNIESYASAENALKTLRDVTQTATRSISTFNKETLRTYLLNIGSNEKNLRNVSRYLSYRSHVFFRLLKFYSTMFDLRCRKVVPQYNLLKPDKPDSILRAYGETLDVLERMNLHGNMTEVLERCFVDDVCYSLVFYDETGMFFYILDPDYCKIDGRYMTGDFSFSIDMSQWRSVAKQQEIEWLGEPLVSMYNEYKTTKEKWVHVPDEYCAVFKFRIDLWDTVIPPLLSLFNGIINLEDLADVQAVADEQQIYKLVYLPMKTLSGTKQSDDFEISPDLMLKYFDRLVDEALPDYISAAPIPGDELKTIDFSDNAASDTNRIEQASTALLNTSGGGMVLNTSKITTNAGFEAALKMETEFGVSTLIPQINGFTNRFLRTKIGDTAAKVEHFEVSIYTKEALAKQLLESAQYSYPNKLAYNTLLGISEKDTLAMLYLEEEVLQLHERMKHPLVSSHTMSSEEATGEVGQGAPTKDSTELSPDGDRSRNR